MTERKQDEVCGEFQSPLVSVAKRRCEALLQRYTDSKKYVCENLEVCIGKRPGVQS